MAQVPNPGSEGKVPLQWAKNYDEALKRAGEEKKPLLIDVTTDWCGWSKKMDRESFADTAVQKVLRSSFVLLRLNPEASEQNRKVAERYGAADSYPTLIVANYKGEEIGTHSGFASAKDLSEFLHRYLPLFSGNPLGYKSVQLPASDPLIAAIRKIPAPERRPASLGSFVVLDQSTIQLQANGSAKFVIRTATFVSDPDKFDLPSAERHYVSSRQKAKFRSVRILDTTGKGREIDVKLAKDEHAYSNQNVYWDVRSLSLEVPTLKEGQILDVIEETECQPVMPGHFYFRWNTGLKVLLTSDLTINFPASLKLAKRAFRCPTEVTETKNSDGTTTWRLLTSNPTPYEPALFSPPIHEIWEGYEFCTPGAKDEIAVWFSDQCRGRDTLPASAKQKVAGLKKEASTNQVALLQGIMDWVTKDVRYVSVAFGRSSHQPHAVSETLTNLYGDCKDQSLLVQALCREAGIHASLVLLDADGEGFEESAPVAIERFNHCIVQAKADGRTFYLDPAWGQSKVGWISSSYAGSRALMIEGPTAKAVTLPPYEPQADRAWSETVIRVNPNASGTITETGVVTGEAAKKMKEQSKEISAAKMRKYLEESYKRTGRKLLDFYVTDTNAPGDKYETRISYTIPRFGSMTLGGLMFKMGEGRGEENWIDALNMPRTQPFRFSPTDPSKVTFTVELPAGATLKGRPNDLLVDTAFLKASRKLTVQGSTVTVVETTRLGDAHVEANRAKEVYDAFRKLHEHRDYSYVVEMPPLTTAATGQQEDGSAGLRDHGTTGQQDY